MQPDAERQLVLFLCTHNSARSQMAEGVLRELAGSRWNVASAGTVATSVRPEALTVMREIGIDIGAQTSKTLEPFLDVPIGWLITVCDAAREACPTIPGVRRQLHWSIDDPAAAEGTEAQRLEAFRLTRDELRRRIAEFVAGQGI